MEAIDLSPHMKPVEQMTKEDYQALLQNRMVMVTFIKKGTNEVRVMQATLHPEVLKLVIPPNEVRVMQATLHLEVLKLVIPPSDGPAVDKPKRAVPADQVPCWDLSAGAWRSFNLNTVTAYETIPVSQVIPRGA